MAPPVQPIREITNALNLPTQALELINRLGQADAIQKSGSDVLTEQKVASLMGRHRIGKGFEQEFRADVARSVRPTIFHRIKIALAAGAGPTVGQALKDPVLLSMVIQLSLLGFSHEPQSLANAIVSAVQEMADQDGQFAQDVPDYRSLIGTLQACREQTADYSWADLFGKIEKKIRSAELTFSKQSDRPEIKSQLQELPHLDTRLVPFTVLRALVGSLVDLQGFPGTGALDVETQSGISTIMVWCHHVLGLSILVRLHGSFVKVRFGDDTQPNIVVNSGASKSATLLNPLRNNERIFSLVLEDDAVHEISPEERWGAFGFSDKILRGRCANEAEYQLSTSWLIGYVLPIVGQLDSNEGTTSALSPKQVHLRAHTHLTADGVRTAAEFLFAIPSLDELQLATCKPDPPKKGSGLQKADWKALVVTLLTFARVLPSDPENCRKIPLSLRAYNGMSRKHCRNGELEDGSRIARSLPISFEVLCDLLLGSTFSKEYIVSAVLITAWGWSIFFDVIDAIGPEDVDVRYMRVVLGVPISRDVRRPHIIDGSKAVQICDASRPGRLEGLDVNTSLGVSRSGRGKTALGLEADAFRVVQLFEYYRTSHE